MPLWAQAGLWSLLGASSLLVGALLGYLLKLPTRLTAGIMAFGCGVLISAVAYDLIMEGFQQGGLWPIIGGALAGSAAYTIANWLVNKGGGKHRKRSGDQQKDQAGGGMAIAIGSLLDGVPESIVLGIGLLTGGSVSLAMLAAIFLSNLPEGMTSAIGMKKAGRSRLYVFGLWTGVVALSTCAAATGAALLGDAAPSSIAAVNAVAAGALLAMIADTMLPEAVEEEHGGTGMLVVVGLLAAFALSHSSL